ncbi:MAG: SDR family oxidoreductase [Burkholderiales bacterium]
MRVLVCGASGCVGSAVASALRSRGHQVVEGVRAVAEGARSMPVDFMQTLSPTEWAQRLRAHAVDSVVNCVGVLIPGRGQSFERVHALGPTELFRGAAAAGVRRVVQVSALGVGGDAQSMATPYLHSKLRADDALASLPVQWAVVRPSLVYGSRSQSGRLFATLASLPLIGLPGRGAQRVAPVHVFELAEAIVRLLEQDEAPNAVFEIAGARAITYRDMLAHYRRALGLGDALWLPLPMAVMTLGAWCAEALPQKVFSRDTLRMLERGSVAARNDLPGLLGRAPSSLEHGLGISRPEALVDLRVSLSAPLAMALRGALSFMWLYTALISALMPNQSGVLNLLARCGFEGAAGIAALVFSCTLNVVLGTLTLLRPSPWLYALQTGAVLGYTVTAAFSMPELTIDHCGPLVKNLPVLMTVLLLWLAAPLQRPTRVQAFGGQASQAVAGTGSPHRSIATGAPANARQAASPRR